MTCLVPLTASDTSCVAFLRSKGYDKLNTLKMLYLAHATSLQLYQTPLVSFPFRAAMHGPYNAEAAQCYDELEACNVRYLWFSRAHVML
jgi:hypothetical protein